MGRIPDEIIDTLKQRADMVDVVSTFVPLKQRNGDWWGCCPFHKEKSPSFKVNKDKQAYYCFGCKAHGSLFTFIQNMVNTDFPGAVRWLADRMGIEIPETGTASGISKSEAEQRKKIRERRQSLLDMSALWYHQQLATPAAEVARNYLAGRGLDMDAVNHFQIGYSPDGWDNLIKWALSMGYTVDDLIATELVYRKEETQQIHDRFHGRLMFPICNELGKVVGFSARSMSPDVKMAKYINSPESDFFHKGQILYGFNFARTELKKFGHVLICEGQLDVIACHRAGLTNAVASQGTAFTEEHARLLHKSTENAVLSFDGDTAGFKAADRTIKMMHAIGFNVSVVTLPLGEDPDSIFKKGGKDALTQIMSSTMPAIHYLFKTASAMHDIHTAEGLDIIVQSVLEAVLPIKSPVTKGAYCKWIAEQIGMDEKIIFNKLAGMEEHSQMQRQQRQNMQATAIRQQAPVFYAPTQDMQLWYMLLDITLHCERLAQEFAFMEDVVMAIPPTPLGQAVNYVAIYTQQGEWATLPDTLMAMDIFQDADVARAIVASELKEYLAADAEIPAQLLKSFEDCIGKVRVIAINQLISRKQDECSAETDVAKQRQLFAELNALNAQKREITKKLRKF